VNPMGLTEVLLYRSADKGGGSGLGRAHDSQLILALQQGNLDALGQLFKEYRTLVYRTALGITHDKRAAEDILQECFVRLHKYADSVDPERPLKPWIYRVTVNLAYDWSKGRTHQSLDDVLEWLSGIPAAFPGPDRRTEREETSRMVKEVIDNLPPTHRAVVMLFYVENLTVEEIAEVLDLPAGTVKSRLYYARVQLRDALIRRQRIVPEIKYEFT
jgi:RNA polymerase sigma-70 factor, ECF subfamily